MLPSVISSRPAIIRKVVDLPHPDGPTRTTNSSSSMTRLTLLTATTLPYRLVTFSSTTLANALTPLLRQKSAQPPNVTIRPTATCVLPAAVNFPKSEAPRLPSTDTARQASADRAVIATGQRERPAIPSSAIPVNVPAARVQPTDESAHNGQKQRRQQTRAETVDIKSGHKPRHEHQHQSVDDQCKET